MSTASVSTTPAPAAPSVLAPPVRDRSFVVIAAYNEQSVVQRVVQDVQRQYRHVVVVDDGSTDGTFETAQRNAAFVLKHIINRGQGAALQTGIEFALAAGAQYIVTYDADGQHQPADIDAMIGPIAAGECDITLGSRFLGRAVNLPWSRKAMLRMAIAFTRVVNRMPLTDAHNGLRGFSRNAAQRITITADRMAHASELIDLIRLTKLPWREVPVEIHYTRYSLGKGQSSLGALRIMFHYIMARVFR